MATFILFVGRFLFLILLCYFLYHLYRALLASVPARSDASAGADVMGAVRLVSAGSDCSVWVEETQDKERRLAKGDAVPFEDRLEVGRAPGNRVRVADPFVSAHHCIIERRGSEFVLEDLSTNGTAVDGRPVRGQCRLRPGVVIQVGRTRFRFEKR